MEAVEGKLLDRGPGAVGVEADVAEEDPVGGGNRPLPHLDRLAAVEAVGEIVQAPADRLGAAAGPRLDLGPGEAEAGELGGDVGRDPALPGRDLAPGPRVDAGAHARPSAARVARSSSLTLASSWPALRSPMLALSSVPPG